jgi:hypothetical protein
MAMPTASNPSKPIEYLEQGVDQVHDPTDPSYWRVKPVLLVLAPEGGTPT